MVAVTCYLAALAAASGAALAVSPIEVQGSQFVNTKSGERLQLLGVDYQPGGSAGYTEKKDPLSDPDSCLRDAALMQRLGVRIPNPPLSPHINTVRIYNINPELNHDQCVSILNAAGIYLILDVNSPLVNGAINAGEPWTTYNKYYLKRIFAMVEAFKDYPNLIGFFGGNEVLNEDAVEQTPSYVKAVQRDLKAYIKKHAKRNIPVGYSAADIRKQVADQFHYLTCDDGKHDHAGADFWGMNVYSWCGESSYEKAGYDKLTDMFADTSVPVFFSEYGCNEIRPRPFTEVGTIFGDKMAEIWSGGLVYEWTQEENDYGLVKLDKQSGSVKLLADYDHLQKQFAKLNMQKLRSVNATDSAAKAPKCDKSLITSQGFTTDFTLPVLPPGGKELIENGVTGITPGKIVKVTQTQVKAKVVDSQGNAIDNLKLKIVDGGGSNTPDKTNASRELPSATSSTSGTSLSKVTPTVAPTSDAAAESDTTAAGIAASTIKPASASAGAAGSPSAARSNTAAAPTTTAAHAPVNTNASGAGRAFSSVSTLAVVLSSLFAFVAM
ncbi:hypothetical protein KEM52_005541 [Ascosphaera acerosa]|nr:hypothetical protein KEM52_005541 [Ascosphaera acerosa]